MPTLCLNALDDPVCTKAMIPHEKFKVHPHAMLVTTERGAHCGWFGAGSPSTGLFGVSEVNWMDEATLEFFEAVGEYRRQGSVVPSN